MELLVVIAIILILMALLLGGATAVKRAMRKTAAHHTTIQVVNALNAYYSEYGRFPDTGNPPQPGAPAMDSVVGDPAMGATSPNNTIFYTLRNIPKGPNVDYRVNPKKVVFFEDAVAKVNAAGKPKDGFYDRTNNGGTPPPDQDGCLYDPWGNQFGIILDGDGDERIDLKGFYTDFSGANPASGNAPRRKVGVFSMGEDGTLGTHGNHLYRNGTEISDDVVSWEK